MTQAPLTLRRWKRTEYERLVGLGVFEGELIELIGGQLVVAEPQYPYHASSISAVDYAVRAILPAGWIVRTQSPVSLDDSLYARAGIQDYWIVNLVDRVLEVYRDPGPEPSAAYGWRYRSLTSMSAPAVVSPLAFASARIAVADLLP